MKPSWDRADLTPSLLVGVRPPRKPAVDQFPHCQPVAVWSISRRRDLAQLTFGQVNFHLSLAVEMNPGPQPGVCSGYWIGPYELMIAVNGQKSGRKGAQIMLKTPSNVLKTAGNCTSFGLNGSHNYRNSNARKAARLWPPPGTSKPNAPKGLQPIMTNKNRQNDVKCFTDSNLRKRDFRKKSAGHYLTKYNQRLTRSRGCDAWRDCRAPGS